VNEAMVELLARLDEARAAEASGWVVLTIDTEGGDTPVSTYGPCATPEQALVLAGEFDRCEHTGTAPADGSPGWKHIVLPLYEVPGS
jgi:hypothetical protein